MTGSNFSVKHTQSYWDWHGGPRIYILLAIAPSSDRCRIPIESGCHSLDGPYLRLYIPATRPLAATAGDGAARELISHSGTASRQPRDPVGATRNKPAVGPAYNAPGTELLRRVQDKTSSSFASIHARSLLVSPLSIISSAFLMSSISLTVAKTLYKR